MKRESDLCVYVFLIVKLIEIGHDEEARSPEYLCGFS